ncbi:MAG: RNA polymerase sigma factor [Oscillospiraceae bacterium]|nr:RNA polymerase sigma factor [Oscillospiraceae bacterium]
MEDRDIIELYWQRDESAIRETQTKYGAYCYAVAENILNSPRDSEECLSDTWLRAWDSMPPQRPGVLRLFLARITRNLSINRLEALSAQKRGPGQGALVLEELAECLPGSEDTAARYEARELGEAVRRFVRRVPERDGNIFVRRYFFGDPVSAIARRYRISENSVMVSLSRTRSRLRAYLVKEELLDE